MPALRTQFNLTDRQRFISGVVAIVLATSSILTLPIAQVGGMLGGVVQGLLTVLFLVVGTVSIGTSDQSRV